MSWHISVTNAAKKQLEKVHSRDAERIEAVISLMAEDPFFGDIQKMTGQAIWRRRVGSYRIFYKVDGALRVVYILEVKRRTSKTY